VSGVAVGVMPGGARVAVGVRVATGRAVGRVTTWPQPAVTTIIAVNSTNPPNLLAEIRREA